MQPATASVRIKRPRAAVYELVADMSRHAEFLDHFLVDWAMTSESSRGAGATGRVRAKGGGSDDEVEFEIVAADADAVVIDSSSGRRGGRRMRIVYALDAVDAVTTQVRFSLELLRGSIVDRATWSLPRAHLERQYSRGMLRLKGLLEGDPGPTRVTGL
jgi:hypothetical protein